MEILGVGLPEMAFIVLIALILLGPKDMVAAGRTIGSMLRKFYTSPTWLAMRRTGDELQQLPTKLAREAGLQDLKNDVQGIAKDIKPLSMKAFDERRIFDPQPQALPVDKLPRPSLPPQAEVEPDEQDPKSG